MRRRIKWIRTGLLLSLAVAGGLASGGGARADEGIVTFRALAPDTAIKLATATMAACRKQGYQVGVAVVDRSGVTQVMIRDRFAGAHTPETARRKAWTAVSFRTPTTDLANNVKPGSESFGAQFVTGALMLGGGVLIESAGSIIGGLGVSGGVSPKVDENCAKAGLETIQDVLNF